MPIGASSRPMAVFSGFYESSRPPPSGNEGGIVGTYHIDVLFAVTLLAAAKAIWSE